MVKYKNLYDLHIYFAYVFLLPNALNFNQYTELLKILNLYNFIRRFILLERFFLYCNILCIALKGEYETSEETLTHR